MGNYTEISYSTNPISSYDILGSNTDIGSFYDLLGHDTVLGEVYTTSGFLSKNQQINLDFKLDIPNVGKERMIDNWINNREMNLVKFKIGDGDVLIPYYYFDHVEELTHSVYELTSSSPNFVKSVFSYDPYILSFNFFIPHDVFPTPQKITEVGIFDVTGGEETLFIYGNIYNNLYVGGNSIDVIFQIYYEI